MLALLVPAVLILVVGRGLGHAFDLRSFVDNWLYMSAPQFVILSVAALHRPSRKRFLPVGQWSSAALVAVFQYGVLWQVPARESGLAWVLYIPLWMVLVAVVAGWAVWRHRRT